ncbi:MAG TPA: helix-turn-helix domain-containing protein [Victivallales bacterium]|nr:helix-turn-helix domain-containing protein [Victivallales bacterium]
MIFYYKKLKELRKKRKLTLEQLSDLIGNSYRTISAWERNERLPSQTDVRVLSQILCVRVSEISDLEEFNFNSLPYYYNQLSPIDALDYDLSGDISLSDKKYVLGLKRIIETLKSEKKFLKLQNITYKIILESLHSYIYMKNSELCFTYSNAAFLSFNNLKEDEIIGKNNHSLYEKDSISEITAIEKRVLQGDQIINYEILIPGTDGIRKGLFSGSPVYNIASQEISGIIVNILDVTDALSLKRIQK